ncbi:hypothetical protein GCK32_017089, partial [Trichostrongylus colubriformis]
FDHLMEIHWLTNDYVSLVADILQLILFTAVSTIVLRFDHQAHYILQSVEIEFQREDGFTTTYDAIIATICYAAIQASQWLQYLSMRRILALSDRDCQTTKRFLPLVAIGGLLMAWIHFGITFFDTNLIKYQLTDENFKYMNMGFFQLGTPRMSISHSHLHNDGTPEVFEITMHH